MLASKMAWPKKWKKLSIEMIEWVSSKEQNISLLGNPSLSINLTRQTWTWLLKVSWPNVLVAEADRYQVSLNHSLSQASLVQELEGVNQILELRKIKEESLSLVTRAISLAKRFLSRNVLAERIMTLSKRLLTRTWSQLKLLLRFRQTLMLVILTMIGST